MQHLLQTISESVIVVKDDKYKRTLGSFFIPNSIMTKLFVLPSDVLLPLVSLAALRQIGPGGGSFISSPKRCTRNVHVHECLNSQHLENVVQERILVLLCLRFLSSLVRSNQCHEVDSNLILVHNGVDKKPRFKTPRNYSK